MNSITFYDLIRLLDLEQNIKVFMDGAEVYSGALEEMCAGQLLMLEKNKVEMLKADKAQIVFLKN